MITVEYPAPLIQMRNLLAIMRGGLDIGNEKLTRQAIHRMNEELNRLEACLRLISVSDAAPVGSDTIRNGREFKCL